MEQKKISVVIPCYKSEKSIEEVIRRTESTIEMDERFDYEIICVNDCSPDDTIKVLRTVAENDKKVKVISLSRNFGQHGALMAGFHYVSGDIVLCMDDDGETPPEELFKLVDKLFECDYDLVSARYPSDERGIVRSLGSKASYIMSQLLLGRPKEVQLNSFFVCRKYIIKEIIKYNNSYPLIHGLILRVTKNMADVPVNREKRITGKSGYTIKKLFGMWMNGFTAFSEKPLRMATCFGLISSFIGFVLAIYVIVRKLLHINIQSGYTSIMAVMLIMFGIVLLMQGLVGEYIGRMYISINNAPQFVVKEELNTTEDDILEVSKNADEEVKQK